MDTISYITDSEGKRTGLIVNLADTAEGKILDYWLREPKEKRKNLSLYLARFLYELSSKQAEKMELSELIARIEDNENETEAEPIVVYTTKDKGLTQKEYAEHILKICEECDNGIGLLTTDEVEKRLNEKIAQYESDLA